MKNAAKPINLDQNDIKDLDSINWIILKYSERLLDSTANHFDSLYLPKKSDPNRVAHWYFTNPYLIEKYLPEEKNYLQYLKRHSFAYKEYSNNFIINQINYFPSDSIFRYDIKYINVCDTSVSHELWHKIPSKILANIQSEIIYEFDISISWKYLIRIEYNPGYFK